MDEYKSIAQMIAYRFFRGFVAGALATATSVNVAAFATTNQLFPLLATTVASIVIGGITGGLLALEKWVRTPAEQ